ncbi:cellulose synthase catalytic subunit [Phenylobacterium sp. LjRoot225]|uniref:glycosyltransferase family 2 protein n=1 Tax=Phenylobacterium sp. LjRoot225 TaxID=3342285 RepID=UPI003ECCD71F
MAAANLTFGGWYIAWRWTHSLNLDAPWFSIPMAACETLAYFGLFLFTANLWKSGEPCAGSPPITIQNCDPEAPADRPISVDVFIATYNEDEELVRLSIRDAKRLRYPHPIDLQVHVLDDGRRQTMRKVCDEEGVGYITRTNNLGYKAGNLRNAMELTSGDFIVICDADTRLFPGFVEHTLGYFRDPQVAFVQTPQWFYDIPEGVRLRDHWGRKAGAIGRISGGLIERLVGEIRVGEDPFANDPKMFYDVIMRRRNWANAVFCCGAASIHRREAVMYAAVRAYAAAVHRETDRANKVTRRLTGEARLAPELSDYLGIDAAVATELTPYKFHVSEDIYTSLVLHQDRERGWKSLLHPQVESKMLSPQDLLSWTIQRFKYAGGSLDILFHSDVMFGPGLTFWQRVMYGATFWGYLGAVWNLAFLAAPIVYLCFGIAPVAAYTGDFFIHLLPFLITNELAFMFGTWGVAGYKGKTSYLASFPISLRALWAVLSKQTIKFPVTPKDRQEGNHLALVWPQTAVMVASFVAIAVCAVRLALGHQGFTLGGLLANAIWALYNCLIMSVMVSAAFWKPPAEDEPVRTPAKLEEAR